jgi:hypothetical protein
MNGMEPSEDDFPVLELLAKLAGDSRSSSEIARLSGVSQPTVSRLRLSNGARIRRSGPFNKLCSFYGILHRRVGGVVGYNELLRDAILEAWDGSERHGDALLTVIKGLKELSGGSGSTGR